MCDLISNFRRAEFKLKLYQKDSKQTVNNTIIILKSQNYELTDILTSTVAEKIPFLVSTVPLSIVEFTETEGNDCLCYFLSLAKVFKRLLWMTNQRCGTNIQR